MIIVSGHITVPANRMAELLPVAKATLEATRKEAGCIVYSYAVDVLDPTLIRIYEEWDNRAALDAHGKQPHMGPWRAKLAEVGAANRKVIAYEAGEPRAV